MKGFRILAALAACLVSFAVPSFASAPEVVGVPLLVETASVVPAIPAEVPAIVAVIKPDRPQTPVRRTATRYKIDDGRNPAPMPDFDVGWSPA